VVSFTFLGVTGEVFSDTTFLFDGEDMVFKLFKTGMIGKYQIGKYKVGQFIVAEKVEMSSRLLFCHIRSFTWRPLW